MHLPTAHADLNRIDIFRWVITDDHNRPARKRHRVHTTHRFGRRARRDGASA